MLSKNGWLGWFRKRGSGVAKVSQGVAFVFQFFWDDLRFLDCVGQNLLDGTPNTHTSKFSLYKRQLIEQKTF